MYTRLTLFCLQIINLIAISQLSPAVASPSLLPRLAPSISPGYQRPAYRPPARAIPLRTDSAGVRLNDEKGPSSVTQNTIATERPIPYQLAIGNLIECVQTLIPKFPATLISKSIISKSILIPKQPRSNQRPNK